MDPASPKWSDMSAHIPITEPEPAEGERAEAGSHGDGRAGTPGWASEAEPDAHSSDAHDPDAHNRDAQGPDAQGPDVGPDAQGTVPWDTSSPGPHVPSVDGSVRPGPVRTGPAHEPAKWAPGRAPGADARVSAWAAQNGHSSHSPAHQLWAPPWLRADSAEAPAAAAGEQGRTRGRHSAPAHQGGDTGPADDGIEAGPVRPDPPPFAGRPPPRPPAGLPLVT